jgi:hypothetical protein
LIITRLQLFTGKDKVLLIGWDAFLGDRLAGERLYEDLHTTTETEDEMQGRRESATVLELLASEYQALLV